MQTYRAVTVGAGPAGVAVVGNLLERLGRILWVDPAFNGGLLKSKWDEVPSNTKVKLFIDYAKAVPPFQGADLPSLASMKELDQEKGCSINYAADMCRELTQHLRQNVDSFRGKVESADFNSKTGLWSVCAKGRTVESVPTERLIICTGATPKFLAPPIANHKMHHISLYTALKPSLLRLDKNSKVGVVGSSHSAILVLKNLFDRGVPTFWFTRSPLLYAEFKEGWILRDNTGLKGIAAAFAREYLEDDKLHLAPMITKIDISQDPQSKYEEFLRQCTHYIPSTGFKRIPLPEITADGQELSLQYNDTSGGFSSNGEPVPGLFGAGIAFPERVVDPEGNVEHAVGMWKFMKYLKRVTPEW